MAIKMRHHIRVLLAVYKVRYIRPIIFDREVNRLNRKEACCRGLY